MHKHPILTSLTAAIILSVVLGTGLGIAYPRKASDMFGTEVLAVFAFPFIWLFGFIAIYAIAWWQGISDGDSKNGKP